MLSPERVLLAALALGLSSGACWNDLPLISGEQHPTVAAECVADAGGKSAPYPTTFRFVNDTSAPLFLYRGCVGIDYGISACASGFRDQIGPTYHCACSCDDPACTRPPNCGACPQPEAATVAAGNSLTVDWDAIVVTEQPKKSSGSTFQCVHATPAQAGRYRLAVRVFDDAMAAARNRGGRLVTRDFRLPVPGSVLDVSLAALAEDTCDPTPDQPVPTCTGSEARDVPCALAQDLDFAWEGGLSLSTESSQLRLPSSLAHSRIFSDPSMPRVTCTTAVPRCTRDSRVVTTSDVVRVLAPAGVSQSFAAGATPVYGFDARAGDGGILVLRRTDGTSLGIGDECSGCSAGAVARPLTPSLRAVVPVLSALDAQMRSSPECSAFAWTP